MDQGCRLACAALMVSSAFLVAGCQTASSDEPSASSASAVYSRYSCADGSDVEAWYLTPGSARLLHKGGTIDLASAISASGARYVGGGWEWWTKGGREGRLSPLAPDETIASASGVNCMAER